MYKNSNESKKLKKTPVVSLVRPRPAVSVVRCAAADAVAAAVQDDTVSVLELSNALLSPTLATEGLILAQLQLGKSIFAQLTFFAQLAAGQGRFAQLLPS